MMPLSVRQFFGVAWIIYFLVKYSHSQSETLYIQNLDTQCLRCLCYAATNCELTRGCVQGYCGPYKISRLYWIDAGRLVLPEDDIERSGAFEDCALSYHCAQRLVKNYMAKYAKDCNGDGVTNCDDYSMINFNGGFQCSPDLNRVEAGRNWTERYIRCAPV